MVKAFTARWLWAGGAEDRLQESRAIVLDGATIDSVVDVADLPDSVDLTDWGDATIMPGLVDCHVHLVWGAEADPQRWVDDHGPLRTLIRMVGHADQTVCAGITMVRDLGATDGLSIPLAAASHALEMTAPVIVPAGRAIAAVGGHCSRLGVEVSGVDEMGQAVRDEVAAGADVIKVMVGGGVSGEHETPLDVQLSAQEVAAVVEQAHLLGRRVAAHAYGVEAVTLALDAGVDSIEHGSLIDGACADRMARVDTFLVPTLTIYEATLRLAAGGADVPPYLVAKSREIERASKDAVRLAHERGVPIAAGTDAGASGNPHGELWREAVALARAGIPIFDVLRICTTNGARLLGHTDTAGVVVSGMRADLVAFPGDVTQDLSALRSPVGVVSRGRPIRAGAPASD